MKLRFHTTSGKSEAGKSQSGTDAGMKQEETLQSDIRGPQKKVAWVSDLGK